MSRIRSKGTKPEIAFFQLIKSNFMYGQYPYRKHSGKVPGKPEIAFLKQKVAVFVDGDFWHGYKHKDWIEKLPKKYWQEKILKNIERDRKVNRELKQLGWSVLRIWEHDLGSSNKISEKIRRTLEKNS